MRKAEHTKGPNGVERSGNPMAAVTRGHPRRITIQRHGGRRALHHQQHVGNTDSGLLGVKVIHLDDEKSRCMRDIMFQPITKPETGIDGVHIKEQSPPIATVVPRTSVNIPYLSVHCFDLVYVKA